MNHTAIKPPAVGSDDDWLVSMPKADLHVHLVGSAAPATGAALAARHPDGGVPADAGQLAAFYKFRDFAHFLDVYKLVSDLVRSPEDVVTLVAGMAEDMAGQGTVYAEVTVTPVSHISAGIHPGELAQALDIGAAGRRAPAARRGAAPPAGRADRVRPRRGGNRSQPGRLPRRVRRRQGRRAA